MIAEGARALARLLDRRGVGPATNKMAAVAQQEQGSVLLHSLGCAFRDVLMKDLVGVKDE